MTEEIIQPNTAPPEYVMTDIPEPDPEIVTRLWRLDEHKHDRQIRYGAIAEQLDMLYKDIDAGLLGEAAKTGSFYLHVKGVKDAVPRISDEDKAIVEAELEALFANT